RLVGAPGRAAGALQLLAGEHEHGAVRGRETERVHAETLAHEVALVAGLVPRLEQVGIAGARQHRRAVGAAAVPRDLARRVAVAANTATDSARAFTTTSFHRATLVTAGAKRATAPSEKCASHGGANHGACSRAVPAGHAAPRSGWGRASTSCTGPRSPPGGLSGAMSSVCPGRSTSMWMRSSPCTVSVRNTVSSSPPLSFMSRDESALAVAAGVALGSAFAPAGCTRRAAVDAAGAALAAAAHSAANATQPPAGFVP